MTRPQPAQRAGKRTEDKYRRRIVIKYAVILRKVTQIVGCGQIFRYFCGVMKLRIGILTAPEVRWERSERNGKPTFVLHDVRIGIGFHWDRLQTQEFAGELTILRNPNGTQTAVNTIDLEDYLVSVISSEMSASSPIELLKAHAIISRSWAVRQCAANRLQTGVSSAFESGGHVGFDLCADDHCQRYEGLRTVHPRAEEAVEATRGRVLIYKGEVCDTRFYKCCGGRTELFATCWENKDVPYLQSVECPYCRRAVERLQHGEQAIRDCLQAYDRETLDCHDWQLTYTADELQDILLEKTGIDFGTILALRPIERGASGRISLLEIIGEKRTERIGKELKIRRALSRTCLYSSWFDVEQKDSTFILNGHGWGHGVGLCQLGAAEMALEGFSANDILAYYYPNTEISSSLSTSDI